MCVQSTTDDGTLALSYVTKVSTVFKRGIYNPFTLQGDIVVNGVLASVHSDWFLDSIAAVTGTTSYLPGTYQAILAPARMLYYAVGGEVARKELAEYQETLNAATDNNMVIKPYFDLAWKAVGIIVATAVGA